MTVAAFIGLFRIARQRDAHLIELMSKMTNEMRHALWLKAKEHNAPFPVKLTLKINDEYVEGVLLSDGQFQETTTTL